MDYIIIYLEIEHLLNFLSQEEKGDFLDVIIQYGKNRKEPKDASKNVMNVFNFIKPRLDKQIEKTLLKAEVARQNGKSGGRPKSKNKPNKTQQNPTKPNETDWVFPSFIDKELWQDFSEMRKQIKKPLTDRAIKLILKDLENIENKKLGNAKIALQNSIKNNWVGIFEPKSNNFENKPAQNQSEIDKEADILNKMINDTLFIKISSHEPKKAFIYCLDSKAYQKALSLPSNIKTKIKEVMKNQGFNEVELKY